MKLKNIYNTIVLFFSNMVCNIAYIPYSTSVDFIIPLYLARTAEEENALKHHSNTHVIIRKGDKIIYDSKTTLEKVFKNHPSPKTLDNIVNQ